MRNIDIHSIILLNSNGYDKMYVSFNLKGIANTYIELRNSSPH